VAAILVGLGLAQLGVHWILGTLAGLIVAVLIMFLVGRRMRRRLEPALLQVRRQAEAGMIQPAMETLASLLPLGAWIPLLKGQIYAQMGVLAQQSGKQEQALEYLNRASRGSTEAQLMLAVAQEKAGDWAAARKVLDRAAARQKKSDLFQNVQAFLLHKHGESAQAMARLSRFVDKHGGEASKDNLLRLQNDRRLNMKPFGLTWYALGYEHPPKSVGQVQTARKGFRQPPKNPSKKKRKR